MADPASYPNASPDQSVDTGMPIGVDDKPGKVQRRFGGRANPVSVALQQKNDGPATVSPSYEYMLPKWRMIDALLGGTAPMREAGETYLPRHPYETTDSYTIRISRAVLKNYTARTLETLVGKAFRDPPIPNGDVPAQVLTLLEDIDEEGTDWTVYAQRWFGEAMAKTVAYTLVDYTRTELPASGQRTLADDEREGVRPFWRMYCAEDCIYQRKEKIGGKWKFTEVRLMEREVVDDGEWGSRVVLRIRRLLPGTWDLYEYTKRGTRGNKFDWLRVDGGDMGIPDIPLVDYYTNRTGLGEGKPPLEDLAYINVEHWQSSSDQRNILTVTRFPMLAVSGASASDSEKPVVIGPNKWLSVADPQGKIYYVEHEGKAIDAGSKDLESLEDQMASYGGEFLRTKPGAASATGRVLDTAEAMSPLQAMGVVFEDAINRALDFTAQWLKLKTAGTATFEVKPDISLGDGKDLDMISEARLGRDISRDSYLDELIRRDILSETFDKEKDKIALDAEPVPESPNVSMAFRSGARTGGNPSDKRGPDKTKTGDKQPIQESKPT